MKKHLSEEEREAVKDFLLRNSKDMKPIQGSVAEAASKWNMNPKSIYRIWKRARECEKNGDPINVKSRCAGNKKPKTNVNFAKVEAIPVEGRRTIRQFADSYGTGQTSVWRWMKNKELRAGTSTVHPDLNDGHKIARLKFSLESLCVNSSSELIFKDQSHTIHIDEKWFYMQQLTERFILMPQEPVPYRKCQNKHHVPKIMFMSAISRPIYADNGVCLFDGKIGIFPFVEEVEALRNSVNRPRGTLEYRPIASVDRSEIKKMIINEIVPAIKKKWPANLSKNIFIQQDNARPHFGNDDAEFRAAASGDGFNIVLVNHPAKSPDTNVNDLGFFQSIQSLQQKMQTRNYEELMGAVNMTFEGLEDSTVNKVFLSLQLHLIEIMKRKGHNDYKLPHMGKVKLAAMGELPRDIIVDKALVTDCIAYLLQMGHQISNPILMESMSMD